MIAYIIFFKV